jgi:hypothetical protein
MPEALDDLARLSRLLVANPVFPAVEFTERDVSKILDGFPFRIDMVRLFIHALNLCRA